MAGAVNPRGKQPRRLLVTGGAGFIGSAFVRHVLAADPDACVLVLDLLTYAGNLENLAAVADNPRFRFALGDICEAGAVAVAFDAAESAWSGPVEAVVHFAAETHVDRSIETPALFLRTNVLGTDTMLRAARERKIRRFVHISTDEVYGSLGEADPPVDESAPFRPRSPYAASKAAADHLALAYHHTYGMPVVVVRPSNTFGPMQFPEKLIPLAIARALEGEPVPVYGDGGNIRDWLFVEDACRGIAAALVGGGAGEAYNIGGGNERTNLAVVRALLRQLGSPEDLVKFVEDRPGHDRRYAMDSSKAAHDLDWRPAVAFEDGLARTVAWYRDNPGWAERVSSGAYRDWYRRHYENRANWLSTL